MLLARRSALRLVAAGRGWPLASACAVAAIAPPRAQQPGATHLERMASTSAAGSGTPGGGGGGWWRSGAALGAAAAVAASLAGAAHALTTPAPSPPDSGAPALPEYTPEQVAEHRTPEQRVWVTWRRGVYDITDFIALHPGGLNKIMLAAGGALEPFWGMYQQHNTPEVHALLEPYRIGTLKGAMAHKAFADPWASEPPRHPALVVRSVKPLNAESPLSLLGDALLTPSDVFYVRNHLPVPTIEEEAYRLVVEGDGLRSLTLTLDDLKARFKKHTVAATIECGGNRRADMKRVEAPGGSGHRVRGLDWDAGAIGTATFGGVWLRDVLAAAGLDSPDAAPVNHIHFFGYDAEPDSGTPYSVSIPLAKALSPVGDVLLAYEMNGAPLTRDHGHPVRAVVPGHVGARSVKWLAKVMASADESRSHWQQEDYKAFSPGSDWDNLDWSSAPAIQELPVVSAICTPANGEEVWADEGKVTVRGYSWSGGGRDIIRVDVSADGGATWAPASLRKLPRQVSGRAWAWTLWEASVALPAGVAQGGAVVLAVKATDEAYNTQPDDPSSVWNIRGMANNSWHKVTVRVADE